LYSKNVEQPDFDENKVYLCAQPWRKWLLVGSRQWQW
jgi:hypothetical protein